MTIIITIPFFPARAQCQDYHLFPLCICLESCNDNLPTHAYVRTHVPANKRDRPLSIIPRRQIVVFPFVCYLSLFLFHLLFVRPSVRANFTKIDPNLFQIFTLIWEAESVPCSPKSNSKHESS